jgi:hypothetical protein
MYGKLVVSKLSSRMGRRHVNHVSKRSSVRTVTHRGYVYLTKYYNPREEYPEVNNKRTRGVISHRIIHIEPMLGRGWINQNLNEHGELHRRVVGRIVNTGPQARLWGPSVGQRSSGGQEVETNPPTPHFGEGREDYLKRIETTWSYNVNGSHKVWIPGEPVPVTLARVILELGVSVAYTPD